MAENATISNCNAIFRLYIYYLVELLIGIISIATYCAERTAFFKAVSEGVREFRAICIVGGKDGKLTEYTAPCGVCRQVMMEFCDPKTFQIILAVDKERYEIYTLEELMPLGFGPLNLV